MAASGRISAHSMIRLRWVKLALELTAGMVLLAIVGPSKPLTAAFSVVAATAGVNLFYTLGPRRWLPNTQRALAMQIGFDIVQFSALFFLTGGTLNPFSLLLIAPVGLAAATLRWPLGLGLASLAAGLTILLAFFALPVPWQGAGGPAAPLFFHLIIAGAIVMGIAVTAAYAWVVAAEARRMELALNVTQTVLAREQRLSALGGLAAAAAHELGTPLATISIVAKELVREAPDGAVREDAELLVSQAERCREILHRLTETPDTDDAMHARMSLLQFANEVIESHVGGGVRVEAVVVGPPGERPPEIRRMPEVLHAMTSLVENAVDFARSEVLVRVRFDADAISVEVRDDGPGFSADVLAKLGQPYVTSRPGGEGSRTGHQGMGLGFFIAKTLLERTRAVVTFHNGRPGGAIIAARWPREAIEAPLMSAALEMSLLNEDD
jgi:two-component system sensor histidine kinase RegB